MALRKPYDYMSRQYSWRSIYSLMKDDQPFADIAARIIWHRQLEGLTQREYAERAGLKRNQLSNWETGEQRVSIDGARALRHTYGLSLDFIYEGIDEALPMTLRAALRDNPIVNESK